MMFNCKISSITVAKAVSINYKHYKLWKIMKMTVDLKHVVDKKSKEVDELHRNWEIVKIETINVFIFDPVVLKLNVKL